MGEDVPPPAFPAAMSPRCLLADGSAGLAFNFLLTPPSPPSFLLQCRKSCIILSSKHTVLINEKLVLLKLLKILRTVTKKVFFSSMYRHY